MKPAQFLLVALFCCGCASQHTATAVIEMEKPAAPPSPPNNQHTGTAAVEMEEQAITPSMSRPRMLSETREAFQLRRSNALAIARSPGPISDYDANLRKRIDKRWRELIAKSSYAPRAGKVVVEFGLIIDGSVAGCRMIKNDVGEWGKLCREAIEQAAPFGPWPPEMRRLFGSDYRDIRFTFDYAK